MATLYNWQLECHNFICLETQPKSDEIISVIPHFCGFHFLFVGLFDRGYVERKILWYHGKRMDLHWQDSDSENTIHSEDIKNNFDFHSLRVEIDHQFPESTQ